MNAQNILKTDKSEVGWQREKRTASEKAKEQLGFFELLFRCYYFWIISKNPLLWE